MSAEEIIISGLRQSLDTVGKFLTRLEQDEPTDLDEARKAYDRAYDRFEELRSAYLGADDRATEYEEEAEGLRRELQELDPKAYARSLLFEAEGILLTGDSTGALQYLLRALRAVEAGTASWSEVTRL